MKANNRMERMWVTPNNIVKNWDNFHLYHTLSKRKRKELNRKLSSVTYFKNNHEYE